MADINLLEPFSNMSRELSRSIDQVGKTYLNFLQEEQKRIDQTWLLEVQNKMYEEVESKLPEIYDKYKGKDAVKALDEISKEIKRFEETYIKPVNENQRINASRFFNNKVNSILDHTKKYVIQENLKYETDTYKAYFSNLIDKAGINLSLPHFEEVKSEVALKIEEYAQRFGISNEVKENMKKDILSKALANRVNSLVSNGNIVDAYTFLDNISKNNFDNNNFDPKVVEDLKLRYKQIYLTRKAEDIIDEYILNKGYKPNQFLDAQQMKKELFSKIKDEELKPILKSLIDKTVKEREEFLRDNDEFGFYTLKTIFYEELNKGSRLNDAFLKALSRKIDASHPGYNYFSSDGKPINIYDTLTPKAQAEFQALYRKELDDRLRMSKEEQKRISSEVFASLYGNWPALQNTDLLELKKKGILTDSQYTTLHNQKTNKDFIPGVDIVKKFANNIDHTYIPNWQDLIDEKPEQLQLKVAELRTKILQDYESWALKSIKKGGNIDPVEFLKNYGLTTYPEKGVISRFLSKFISSSLTEEEERLLREKGELKRGTIIIANSGVYLITSTGLVKKNNYRKLSSKEFNDLKNNPRYEIIDITKGKESL